jgi:hypothetical protein
MATSVLDIPTNVGPSSYGGLGAGYQGFMGNDLLPLLQQLVSGYATNVDKAYNNANTSLGTITRNTITPAIQSTINGLAGRNMINSSVAGDAMSKTISNLSSDLLNKQAGISANKATALTSGYGDLLTNLANLGRYQTSGDTSTPYQIMANLLQSMM